ncbi:hypothetical protein KPH14_008481 [Odynerus spinipes]|uniref:DUF7041 domain-containing protein n=1 Tax=Odynerus spinipes TaxID=1348599 RepID=A0AAD9RF92_9HYME|nr:hypothetical protein KPH14_008481 [Odynerus spinipes]
MPLARSPQREGDPNPGEGDETVLPRPAINAQNAAAVEIQASEFRNVRLHTFWKNRPKLWFTQLECEFAAYRIRSDDIKFSAVVRHLDEQTMMNVADVLEQPPDTGKYDRLKAVLIERYTDSTEKQLRALLGGVELGDKTPSTLLREMRTLAGGSVQDDMLRTLWMQRLPQRTQELLAVLDEVTLDKLAACADKALERTLIPSIASVSDSSANETIARLSEKVDKLTTQIAAMSRRSRKPERSRSTSKSRSKSRSKSQEGWCFYHRRFKERAFKCTQPCRAPYTLADKGNSKDPLE